MLNAVETPLSLLHCIVILYVRIESTNRNELVLVSEPVSLPVSY